MRLLITLCLLFLCSCNRGSRESEALGKKDGADPSWCYGVWIISEIPAPEIPPEFFEEVKKEMREGFEKMLEGLVIEFTADEMIMSKPEQQLGQVIIPAVDASVTYEIIDWTSENELKLLTEDDTVQRIRKRGDEIDVRSNGTDQIWLKMKRK